MNAKTLSRRPLSLCSRLTLLTGSVVISLACGETDPDTGKAIANPSVSSTTDASSPTGSGSTLSSSSLPATSGSSAPASTSAQTSDSSAPPANVPSFEEISGILLVTCGNIICHMPPPYTPPDLSGGGTVDLYTQLTTYQVNNCGGSTLVVPGNVAESALVKVVSGECGGFYMPPDTYFPFTDDELSKIRAWIAAGAPNQ
jgi:hypothetical protein